MPFTLVIIGAFSVFPPERPTTRSHEKPNRYGVSEPSHPYPEELG
jgi:hypothetical protein